MQQEGHGRALPRQEGKSLNRTMGQRTRGSHETTRGGGDSRGEGRKDRREEEEGEHLGRARDKNRCGKRKCFAKLSSTRSAFHLGKLVKQGDPGLQPVAARGAPRGLGVRACL